MFGNWNKIASLYQSVDRMKNERLIDQAYDQIDEETYISWRTDWAPFS